MSACEEYIIKMIRVLPERCSVRDLVEAGIFNSHATAYHARSVGKGPEFFKFEHTIFYPKTGVIEYLKKAARKTNN